VKIFGYEISKAPKLVGTWINTTNAGHPKEADDNFSENKNLSFKIFFAEGGVILQSHFYDPKSDRFSRKLHLIPEDKDIATEVGNIISMTLLRTP
jgi:hypothetical protein